MDDQEPVAGRLHLVLHTLTRGATVRNSPVGSAASSSRISEVVFEPMPSMSQRSSRDADAHPEPGIALLVHQDVLVGGPADLVPPQLERPPGLVDAEVEHLPRVEGERAAVANAGHLVVDHLPRREVLDAQVEPLVPSVSVAYASQRWSALTHTARPARRTRGPSPRHCRRAAPARRRPASLAWLRPLPPGWRAAVGRVLRVLERAGVVPPVAAANGDGEVGLQGPGPDLVEDRLAERPRCSVICSA